MSEQASFPTITDLPTDILDDIFGQIGDVGCTVLSHVNKDLKRIMDGRYIEREFLYYDATVDDHLEILKWLKSAGYPVDVYPAMAVCNLEMLKWMHSVDDDWDTDVIRDTYENAVEHDQMDTIKWLCTEGYDANQNLCETAAKFGNVRILEWSLANGHEIDEFVYENAAEGGHIELVKWIRAMKPCPCDWTSEMTTTAAHYGQFDFLKWARDNGCPIDFKWGLYMSVLSGHLEIAKWFYNQHPYPGADLWDRAARGGHVHILGWLLDINQHQSPNAYKYAAEGGHVIVIEWLLANNFNINADVLCITAAENGRLELLKWAQSKGYTKDFESLLFAAVSKGQLELTKWIYGQYEYLLNDLWNPAAYGGHIHILDWLLSVNHPQSGKEYGYAARGGHVAAVAWLLDNNFDVDENDLCNNASANGHFNLLQWLHKNNYHWDEEVCRNASRRGHFDMFVWACENGCPCDDDDCMSIASASQGIGFRNIVKYLRKKRPTTR